MFEVRTLRGRILLQVAVTLLGASVSLGAIVASGPALLTGIAASNPLYADAVMQRMLTDDMDAYLTKKNAYPGLVSVFFNGSAKKNGLIKENEALAHAVHGIAHLASAYGIGVAWGKIGGLPTISPPSIRERN